MNLSPKLLCHSGVNRMRQSSESIGIREQRESLDVVRDRTHGYHLYSGPRPTGFCLSEMWRISKQIAHFGDFKFQIRDGSANLRKLFLKSS